MERFVGLLDAFSPAPDAQRVQRYLDARLPVALHERIWDLARSDYDREIHVAPLVKHISLRTIELSSESRSSAVWDAESLRQKKVNYNDAIEVRRKR